MRFKIDENLPVELAELLRQTGYDAETVLDEQLGGELDTELARTCQQELRVLITLDMGFADIRTYPPAEYPGLIVLRLKRQDQETVLSVCRRMLGLLTVEPLEGRLWIVDEERVRVRGA